MEINFVGKGIVQIDNARIVYRNFSGVASKFNKKDDRNFAVVIPDQEIAEALSAEGWNVKIKPPRDEDESPFMILPVKVKFNGRGPKVYLASGDRMNVLDESQVGIIDDIDIERVDLDIRPYDWEVNGDTGRTAYLQSMKVTQRVDRFARDIVED